MKERKKEKIISKKEKIVNRKKGVPEKSLVRKRQLQKYTVARIKRIHKVRKSYSAETYSAETWHSLSGTRRHTRARMHARSHVYTHADKHNAHSRAHTHKRRDAFNGPTDCQNVNARTDETDARRAF